MLVSLLEPLLLTCFAFTVLVLLRRLEVERAMAGARTFQLHFPRGTEAKDVTVFLAGLSGVRPPWYWRWLSLPTVTFEAQAGNGVIEHRIIIPRALTGAVLSHLRAALPSVRLDRPSPVELPAFQTAAELTLTSWSRPLRLDQHDHLAAALLTSLLPLRQHEQILVQWLLTPARLARPPRLPASRERNRTNLLSLAHPDGYELSPHAEGLKALRAKQAEPLFASLGRVAVQAADRQRRRYLLDRVVGRYQLLSAPGVMLRRRALSESHAAHRTSKRTIPIVTWPAILNASELAAVIGWPIGVLQLPGLSLGGCRQLPPAADVPSTGCVVAQATFPGSERLIAIAPPDRLLHLHVCGPTGSGKSNLLLNLIVQDMQAGRGVVVVDPKGDLVTDALRRIPPERIHDVIVLDPSDDDRPVGLNLLAASDASAELIAEHVVFVFHQLFSSFWGPRTDDVLRAALLTLMSEPGMTLVEVPLLLTNPGFRKRFVARVSDDLVGLGAFWSYYDKLRPNDQAQVIAPLMNKLRATLLRSRVRYCIGQADSPLDLGQALDAGKLLFVPLRKGTLGDEAAALLGSLFVARLWQTIQGRSAVPEPERRPVHLYIDEAQSYLNLPTSVGDMLAQARGLGLGVTLANQHLSQWPSDLLQDVMANCRSKVIFQPTAKDARSFEHELKPYLRAEDLQGLGRFEVVAQLAVGQRVAAPVTGVTLPAGPETHRLKTTVEWSRQHYGQQRSAIAEAMRARQTGVTAEAPIGRQRKAGAT